MVELALIGPPQDIPHKTSADVLHRILAWGRTSVMVVEQGYRTLACFEEDIVVKAGILVARSRGSCPVNRQADAISDIEGVVVHQRNRRVFIGPSNIVNE